MLRLQVKKQNDCLEKSITFNEHKLICALEMCRYIFTIIKLFFT